MEPYRREGEHTIIEIAVKNVGQLFNSFDPSPFHEKDLDSDAEDYIVGAAREIGPHARLKLVLHLPADEAARDTAADLERSIHNYFDYRHELTQRDLRYMFRLGRASLLIAIAFLAACMSVREVVLSFSEGGVLHIVAEGLLIAGWVAMWRPIQIFLYDWWPLRRTARIHAALAKVPVEVRPLKT
jgi:hypothetical protein